MSRDRRRSPRLCRPRQGARLVRGSWTIDNRWVGVATVPRSVAAAEMLDFTGFDDATQPGGPVRTIEQTRASSRRRADAG